MGNYFIIKRTKRAQSNQYSGFTKDPASVELHFDEPQTDADTVGVRIYCHDNYFFMGEGEIQRKTKRPLEKCKLKVSGEGYWMPGRYIAYIYVGESAHFFCRFVLSTDRKERVVMDMERIVPNSPGDFFANCLCMETWYQRLQYMGLSFRFHMRLLLMYMQDERMREEGMEPTLPITVCATRENMMAMGFVAEQLDQHMGNADLVSSKVVDALPTTMAEKRTLYVDFKLNVHWYLYTKEHPIAALLVDEKAASDCTLSSLKKLYGDYDPAKEKTADEETEEQTGNEEFMSDFLNDENARYPMEPSPQAELDALVGLGTLKEDLRRASLLALFHKRRRELMLESDTGGRHHMLFLGNPGTGKTTVARIIGQMYREMGLLSRGHTVVTERSGLIGEFIGQTEGRMKEVIEQARGGVLFIDEAYTLFAGDDDQRDYGKHALECLLTVLAEPNPDMLIIMAGYERPMQELLKSNPGLRDRFPLKFRFEDFTEEELVEVALRLAHQQHYEFSEEAEQQLRRIVHLAYQHRDADFANARWVHNFFEQGIEKCMALRVMSAPSAQDIRTFSLIQASDLLEAERTYLRDTAPYKAPKPRIGFVA